MRHNRTVSACKNGWFSFNNNEIEDDVKLINHFINNRELLIDKCRNFSLNNISIEIGSTKLSKIYKKTFLIN